MAATRVCFVCLGNICRSPTAEAIMEHRLGFEEIGVHVEVESAGTGSWHAGYPPDERARDEATRRGSPWAAPPGSSRPTTLHGLIW